MDPVVALCLPIYESVKAQTMASLLELELPCTVERLHAHGMLVDQARALMTHVALASERPRISHLLWADSDVVFPRDALVRLLAHRAPIVGGLYFNRRPPYEPVIRRKATSGDLEILWEYPAGLVEVDRTGAGFLLVERCVFDAVGRDAWKPRDGVSEDFSFADRCREAGFRILVDTTLEIGHVAEVVVDARVARVLRGAHSRTA